MGRECPPPTSCSILLPRKLMFLFISSSLPFSGMSKDKCGAANVAGFIKAVAMLAPRNVRVIAELGFVRNSVGSNAYVDDEIIRSHAGVRGIAEGTE